MRRLYTLVVALGIMSSGACASAGAGMPEGAQEPDATATMIEVDNKNWQDVVIYAVRSGMKFRLGMVNGLSTKTFRMPASLGHGTRLQLLADPIGSTRTYLTEPIPASSGQTVMWRLGTNLQHSNFAVR